MDQFNYLDMISKMSIGFPQKITIDLWKTNTKTPLKVFEIDR